MKESATLRYMLRAVVAMTLSGLGALGTAYVDGGIDPVEVIAVATATIGALGAYLGLGGAWPQMEPFIGNKLEGAEVPVPPAKPEPAS